MGTKYTRNLQRNFVTMKSYHRSLNWLHQCCASVIMKRAVHMTTRCQKVGDVGPALNQHCSNETSDSDQFIRHCKEEKIQFNIQYNLYLLPEIDNFCYYPANTKHLYNICTMLDQRRRRWADVVQMLYKCFVCAG